MLFCSLRTQDGEGPWLPCLEPAVLVDPDGDALCAAHLEKLWHCPECGWFIVSGDTTLCATCQAEADAFDSDLWF
jgi:hypothetical protein